MSTIVARYAVRHLVIGREDAPELTRLIRKLRQPCQLRGGHTSIRTRYPGSLLFRLGDSSSTMKLEIPACTRTWLSGNDLHLVFPDGTNVIMEVRGRTVEIKANAPVLSDPTYCREVWLH